MVFVGGIVWQKGLAGKDENAVSDVLAHVLGD